MAARGPRDEGAAAYDAIAPALDQPMLVVTVRAGARRAGCLVGFSTQASIDPARHLVCLSRANRTHRVARDAHHLAVHVLARRDTALAELFGGRTGDRIDKFAECAWRDGPHGLPILDDAPAWFAGPIVSRTPLGDHTGFLLQPDAGARRAPLDELCTLRDALHITPGHGA